MRKSNVLIILLLSMIAQAEKPLYLQPMEPEKVVTTMTPIMRPMYPSEVTQSYGKIVRDLKVLESLQEDYYNAYMEYLQAERMISLLPLDQTGRTFEDGVYTSEKKRMHNQKRRMIKYRKKFNTIKKRYFS